VYRAGDAAMFVGFAAQACDQLAELTGEIRTLRGVAPKDALKFEILGVVCRRFKPVAAVFAGFDQGVEEINGLRSFSFHVV
jgi:hypothetical protein